MKAHTFLTTGLLPLMTTFIAGLTGCSADTDLITYVCDEPLGPHLEQARSNLASGIDVERNRRFVDVCPGEGYHRRYTFVFEESALVSRQQVAAEVRGVWCNDGEERVTTAELHISRPILAFDFTYQWPTETGKYPETTFNLNRISMQGGFLDSVDWQCRLLDRNRN